MLVALAAWIGLLAGTLDALRLHHEPAYHTYLWWMAPYTNVLLFGAMGCLLQVGARPQKLRTSSLLLFFCALYFPLMGRIYSYMRWWSMCGVGLLCLGFAVQLSRLVEQRAALLGRFLRVFTLPLMVCLMFALVVACLPLSEAPLSAPSAARPNVLLVVMDTVRAQNLSLYGYKTDTTPWLTRLAASGVLYRRAYACANWTIPSHVSIFTGHYPSELQGRKFQPLSDRYPTLAEVLRSMGYRTGGFVANLPWCGSGYGFNRGFTKYDEVAVSWKQSVLSCTFLVTALHSVYAFFPTLFNADGSLRTYWQDAPAAAINRAFLDWQRAQPAAPFFAYLNYMDAHDPIDPTYGRGVAGYDGAIRAMDEQIHLLLEELDRRKVLSNTLVIVTSDHGEQFGEHGLSGHGNSMYIQLLHVPLVVYFPARLGGTVVEQAISQRGLAATIVQLVGGADNVFPSSLAARDPVYSEYVADDYHYNADSLIIGNLHYVRNMWVEWGREELYDLAADPDESTNVLHAHMAEVLRFRQIWKELRASMPKLH